MKISLYVIVLWIIFTLQVNAAEISGRVYNRSNLSGTVQIILMKTDYISGTENPLTMIEANSNMTYKFNNVKVGKYILLAFIDLNNNSSIDDESEPFGYYSISGNKMDTLVVQNESDILTDINIIIHDIGYYNRNSSISGKIINNTEYLNYNIYVLAVLNPNSGNKTLFNCIVQNDGSFKLEGLVKGTYVLYGIIDTNGNNQIDTNDFRQCYRDEDGCIEINLDDNQNLEGIEIVLEDKKVSKIGKIKGVVYNLTEDKESDIYVKAFLNPEINSYQNFFKIKAGDDGGFVFDSLPVGRYLISAFLDKNGNGEYDSAEIMGCYIDTLQDTTCSKVALNNDDSIDGIYIFLFSRYQANSSVILGKVISNRSDMGPIRVVCENSDFHQEIILDYPSRYIFRKLESGFYKVWAFLDENADSVYNDGEFFSCLKENDNGCDSIYIAEGEKLEDQNIILLYPYLRLTGKIIDKSYNNNYIVYLKTDTLLYGHSFEVLNIGNKQEFFLDIFKKNTYYLYVVADVNKNNKVDLEDRFGFFDRNNDGSPDPLEVSSFLGNMDLEIEVKYFIKDKIQAKAVINGKIVLKEPNYPVDSFKVKAINSLGKVFISDVGLDSSFSLNLSPGKYILFTEKTEKFYRTYYPSTLFMDSAVILELKDKDTINDINVYPIVKELKKGVLNGFVFDSITNSPLINAVVQLYNDSVKVFKMTDTAGFFSSGKVKAGSYNLIINKAGYTPYKDSSIVIEADSVRELIIKLFPYSYDTIKPEIQAIYPLPFAMDVSNKASIVIAFYDNQTGINKESISISINYQNILLNESDGYYKIGERAHGYIFRYSPKDNFLSGDTVYVSAEVQDLQNNKAHLEYYFVIQKDTIPPRFVNPPEIKEITEKSVYFIFSTNEKARAIVKYFEKEINDTLIYSIDGYQQNFNVFLTNLKSKAVYKGIIELYDQYGNGPHKSKIFHFKTLPAPDTISPIFVNEPYFPYISNSKALLVFKTDEPTNAIVVYGLTNALQDTILDRDYKKNHFITLDSLKEATEYFCKIVVFDRDSNSTESKLQAFSTKINEDENPPVFIRGPVITGIKTDQATLFALTNEIASVNISLEDTTGKVLSFYDDSLVYHKIDLIDLEPSTKYSYSIFAVDLNGNESEEIKGEFTTKKYEDTLLLIKNVRTVSSSNNSAMIMWENNKLTTGFVYYGTDMDNFDIFEETAVKRFHQVALSNLQVGVKYYFYIKSIDLSYNSIISDTFDFILEKIEDSEPPVIIAGPKVNIYDNKVVYQFKTDEPAIVQFTYWEENNQNLRNTITEEDFKEKHSLIISDLLPSTDYEFVLTMKDVNGNMSSWPQSGSSKLARQDKNVFITSFFDMYQTGKNSFNTNSNADTTAPNIILGPTAFERTDNYITLYWKTDEPSIGEAYCVKNDNSFNEYQTESEYTTEHYFSFYNLNSNSTYKFVIFNTDINNNGPVQYKDTLIYRTNLKPDNRPPELINEIKVTDITADRAVLISKTDKPAIAKVQLYNNEELIKDYASSFREKEHKVFLTNLLARNNYSSTNEFCDGSGNCSNDIIKEFETTAETDFKAPTLVDSAIVVGRDYFRIYLSFDELSTVLVEYSKLEEDNFISVSDLEPDREHDLLITNLEGNTVYKLICYYQDTYGNIDSLVGLIKSTDIYGDTIAPDKPLGLTFSFDELNRLILKWNGVLSKDVTGYNIYIKSGGSGGEFEKIASNIIDTEYIDDRDIYSDKEYAVTAIDIQGNESQKSILKITSVEENYNKEIKFNKLVVENNYPNPFNPLTIIKYYIPRAGTVEIDIFNIIGQRVFHIKKKQDSGWHKFIWEADNKYPTGIYFYRVKFSKDVIIRKMMILK